MATNKKRKNNFAKRKLEIVIYTALVIAAALLVIFVVKLIKGNNKNDDSSSIESLMSLQETSTNDTDSSDAQSSDVISSSAVYSSEIDVSSEAVFAPANSSVSSASHSSSNKLSNGDYIEYTKSGSEEISEWYLRLVNANNILDNSWRPTDLKTIDNDGRKIDSRVYNAYIDLMTAAKADGISLFPISAYRTYDTQNTLFQNRVNVSLSQNPSFTRIEAENDAAKHVARPNTSDHELGLAVDFNSVDVNFANTSAGIWLKKNSADYGFVLRYPEDKQDITMVSYEPWHFRFVGIKHAKKMQELNMCLEEYIEYLK